jgi:hypothetical protein
LLNLCSRGGADRFSQQIVKLEFVKNLTVRDRPFNLKEGGGGFGFFVSFRNLFSDNTRFRIFIYFVTQSPNFFFQNISLDYMTKTLNHIFFFLHQIQNIFFSNIGNQIIFFRKKHNPPFKLNCCSLTYIIWEWAPGFVLLFNDFVYDMNAPVVIQDKTSNIPVIKIL